MMLDCLELRQIVVENNFVGGDDPTTTTTATRTLKYQFKLEKQQDSFETKIYTVLSMCVKFYSNDF